MFTISSMNDLSKLIAVVRGGVKTTLQFVGLTEEDVLAILREAAKRLAMDIEIVTPDQERIVRFMKTGAVIGFSIGLMFGGLTGGLCGAVVGSVVGAGASHIKLTFNGGILTVS